MLEILVEDYMLKTAHGQKHSQKEIITEVGIE